MTTKTAAMIDWNVNVETVGTGRRGFYYPAAGRTFEETVARLITLSKQDPTLSTDKDKVSVEFTGTFEGKVFTLYDYKADRELHVGGRDGARGVDVARLQVALDAALAAVTPTPYAATEYYDDNKGKTHGWGRAIPASAERAFDAIITKYVATFREDGNIDALVDDLLHVENGLDAAVLILKAQARISDSETETLLAALEREVR